ncbi:MAG: 2-C-methyl-D-erythritol 4-phosphate cytidylyltransferase [Burkholderiaceae bacterium]
MQPPATSSSVAPRIWALVPCAGTGSRAAAGLPKQYRHIAGKPLVLHTLAALVQVERLTLTLVVVAPGDRFLHTFVPAVGAPWLCQPCGGASRAETVANGLAALQALGAAAEDWVLVHDGARCLVTAALIDPLIDACLPDAVGGLLALPLSDTLKKAEAGRVIASPDRNLHWLAQTPQMFRIAPLRAALRAAGDRVTDEASAMERAGFAPLLVAGSANNFKVTYPEDFLLAEAVLMERLRRARGAHESDYDYP